jgi:hypothetical protein
VTTLAKAIRGRLPKGAWLSPVPSPATPSSVAEGAGAAARAARLLTYGPVVLPICAVAVWAASLGSIDVRRTTGLGLVSVLPLSFYAGFVLLTAGFCLALRAEPPNVRSVLAHVVVLIFVLYATPTLVEDAPRLATTWTHMGLTEYTMRTGRVDPGLDAYGNWPGFFILSAFVTQVAGLQHPISLTAWAPVFFNLAFLGPLTLILRSATRDARIVWSGAWLFYVGNWVGQDYFAPQALAYLMYLVAVGVLLTWFKVAPTGPDLPAEATEAHGGHASPASGAGGRAAGPGGALVRLRVRLRRCVRAADSPSAPSRPWQRVGLIAVVVLFFAVLVSSHQLTQFFALAAVTALVASNRVTARGLPVLLGVMIGTWLSFMALPFLAGHMEALTSGVGQLRETVNVNVVDRLQGSPERALVVRLRIATTLALWGLALLGAVRRLRTGRCDLNPGLLALAPFPLLALQSYGGEMLLRVYFFALPAVAFFAAALFFVTPEDGRGWRAPAAVGLVSVALLGGFLNGRYGNERMDYFTHQEVEGVRYVYDVAEPGSLLASISFTLPWRFRDYEKFKYVIITDQEGIVESLVNNDSEYIYEVLNNINKGDSRVYLIVTRGQKAMLELFAGVPTGALDSLEDALTSSDRFAVVLRNDDAAVFRLTGGRASGPPQGLP